MITMFAARLLSMLALLGPIFVALQPIDAGAQAQGAQARSAREQAAAAAPRQEQAATMPQPLNFGAQQEKINAWTVGLAAGLIEGAPLRLASEMARVVDDGSNLLVLPIVTRGPTVNLNALLYLRGVDLAIINSDALAEYRVEVPDIERHVAYLLNLFPSALHVFVRPVIKSRKDLGGKKGNCNTFDT